ncbi:unnamed protein product [marine sediment metagenome]|uniref:Uncharacterized protein n=1 Tax=marine sediment metagenome TaxID=412755 RepID=X1MJH6_9ZZZZ
MKVDLDHLMEQVESDEKLHPSKKKAILKAILLIDTCVRFGGYEAE